MHRHDRAKRQAEQNGEAKRQAHQHQRAGQALEDELRHWHVVARGKSEAALREAEQIILQLRDDRQVKAEAAAELRHGLRRG